VKNLKYLINKYMYTITTILVSIILVCVLLIQLKIEQNNAIESSEKVFIQMEPLLEDNQRNLEEIQEEYRETCLKNAEVVARIIESDPDVLNSLDELKSIAESIEVDEIHIFDTTGRIFTGTHPEYYDYTFDSGEQMNFFKPLLSDKTLKLVQDITPNTAEQKLMQYSALWSENGKFIVQVGMEPHNVMKVTEKNELSYIFSQFRVNTEVNYFAIATDGLIVGSNNLDFVNLNSKKIGLNTNKVFNDTDGFHCKIDGINYFCVFKKIDETYIGRCIATKDLYQRIPTIMLTLTLGLVIVAVFLSNAVTRHMNKHVVNKIHDINLKLESITNGNLDETIDIKSSVEFYELSNYINAMVKSILDSNKKMSYILSKTDLYIGIYEYIDSTQSIRYTEYTPRILSLDNDTMNQLSMDKERFKEFINNILNNPIPDEEGVYMISGEPERYIRIEEINNNGEVFGVVIDVTNEIKKRKQLEVERDIDSLTGLYNRRGFDEKLSHLSDKPKYCTNSAIVVIDADGLKNINDTYGHEKGDIYLKEISQLLKEFGDNNSLTARLGGDEFLLLLYNYDNQGDLVNSLVNLKNIQDTNYIQLDTNTKLPLRFSYGYSIINEITDYNNHLRNADRQMYLNKIKRKEQQ